MSITKVSAGLHNITTCWKIEDRSEQGSLTTHLSLRQRAGRKHLEGFTKEREKVNGCEGKRGRMIHNKSEKGRKEGRQEGRNKGRETNEIAN